MEIYVFNAFLGKEMVTTKGKIKITSDTISVDINERLQMSTTLYFDKKKNRFLNKIVIIPNFKRLAKALL